MVKCKNANEVINSSVVQIITVAQKTQCTVAYIAEYGTELQNAIAIVYLHSKKEFILIHHLVKNGETQLLG